MELKELCGSVDIRLRVRKKRHVCIPNALSILVNIGAGNKRVSRIHGQYSQTIDSGQVEETRFSTTTRRMRDTKLVNWGKENAPLSDTVPLKKIFDTIGDAILDELVVQEILYEKHDTVYGIPVETESPVKFHFESWSFKPGWTEKILDRTPSNKFYKRIKALRQTYTDDKKLLSRLRDTWLVNKPPRKNLTQSDYNLWWGEIALFLPESIEDFKGRELG